MYDLFHIHGFWGFVIVAVFIFYVILTLWFVFTVGSNCSHLNEHVIKTSNELDRLNSQIYELNDKVNSIKYAMEQIRDIEVERNKKENSSTNDNQ